MDFNKLLTDFFEKANVNNIDIYNEISLQLELGIFLRSQIKDYKIQFERNISFFGITGTTKHEIDIVIFNKDKKEKYAIELKFPKNGQYPEEMYSFIEDIVFMEELKRKGFTKTYTLVVVSDPLFYEGGRVKTEIYAYFRDSKSITGEISKPTGKNKGISLLKVKNSYTINWKDCYLGKYYFLEIL